MVNTFYAVRAHPILNEDEWPQGTVMYSTHTPDGPWHDMVTGSIDHCWEVLDALQIAEEIDRQNRDRQSQEIREYIRPKMDGTNVS